MAVGDPVKQGVGSSAPMVLTFVFWTQPTPAPEGLDGERATTVTLGWHEENVVMAELPERQIKVVRSHSNVHLVWQYFILALKNLMKNLTDSPRIDPANYIT